MSISVLSHASQKPRDVISGFLDCFALMSSPPDELVVVERDEWDKCAMINEIARSATAEWLFITDIDNRFPVDFTEKIRQHTMQSKKALFFKNVSEISETTSYSDFGAEGVSKKKWAYTAFLVKSKYWHEFGGFDERFKKWGWMDLDVFQSCLRTGGAVVDWTTPIQSVWHPTWKIWSYSQHGEVQMYIDEEMKSRDIWMYKMTLPKFLQIVDKWRTSADPKLVKIFEAWKRNRLIYESKWPSEKEKIRQKYREMFGLEIDA